MTAVSGLRSAVPWWMRIGAKIVLSRLPVSYRQWKRLRLFEHGAMDQPRQALHTFLEHAGTANLLEANAKPPRLPQRDGGFAVLELGPGDSLFTAVIARSMGASQVWLLDAGAFATTEPAAYIRLAQLLQQEGYPPALGGAPKAVDHILHECNASYLTEGVASLARLPDASVDFCFSNAVLEHVAKADFKTLATELRRVLKPGGVCVHRVDLKDHLGGGLNNLRFSAATWEGRLFRNAGFYTNRIRFSEMTRIFEQAGFDCRLPRVIRWERLPIARARMDTAFRRFADQDLLVSGFDAVLRHNGDPA